MNKIVLVIIIFLSFSSMAEEDYSKYYFYGNFNTQNDVTTYFNIHAGRAYLSEDSDFNIVKSIPDGQYQLKTKFATPITFYIKSDRISKLELPSGTTLKDQIFSQCQEAVFLFNYLSLKENLKNHKGNSFQKYEVSNYPKGGDYLFILKDDMKNKIFAVGAYVSGAPVIIQEHLTFIWDKNTESISVANEGHKDKYIGINDCLVTYLKK